MESRPPALVVGAGVSGLTCAIMLLEHGWTVRLVARERGAALVSSVAGAIWYPYHVHHPDAERWALETLERLYQLADHPDLIVRPIMARDLRRTPSPPPEWASRLPYFERLPSRLLPAGITAGYRYELALVETPRYLRWLHEEVGRLGGRIERGEVSSLGEAAAGGRLVVNCTGLAARTLVPDPALYAVRGQIARLTAGLTDEFIFDDHDESRPIYIIPRRDGTIVGGTAEVGDEEPGVRHGTEEEILDRAARLLPALAGARVLESRSGLRPARTPLRLEIEEWGDGHVIHNYGHGGAGFTLSWGCAAEVARLAEGVRG